MRQITAPLSLQSKLIFAGFLVIKFLRCPKKGSLFGFIEIEKLIFNARSGIVVDPSEEKIQTEFSGVNRTYIPMHSVIRIDEVDKQGASKITKVESGNVTHFPGSVYVPSDQGDKGGSNTN